MILVQGVGCRGDAITTVNRHSIPPVQMNRRRIRQGFFCAHVSAPEPTTRYVRVRVRVHVTTRKWSAVEKVERCSRCKTLSHPPLCSNQPKRRAASTTTTFLPVEKPIVRYHQHLAVGATCPPVADGTDCGHLPCLRRRTACNQHVKSKMPTCKE